MENII